MHFLIFEEHSHAMMKNFFSNIKYQKFSDAHSNFSKVKHLNTYDICICVMQSILVLFEHKHLSNYSNRFFVWSFGFSFLGCFLPASFQPLFQSVSYWFFLVFVSSGLFFSANVLSCSSFLVLEHELHLRKLLAFSSFLQQVFAQIQWGFGLLFPSLCLSGNGFLHPQCVGLRLR